MATLYPVAGCHLYIGDAPMDPSNTLDETDFAAVSWVEIGQWTNMGGIGDASQLITTPVINDQRDNKQKGTRNAGSMQNEFGIVPTDAGQIALIGAEQSNNNFPFRMDWNDAVGAGDPTKRMFVGLVTSAQEQGGNANTTRMLSSQVEINSNIVRIART